MVTAFDVPMHQDTTTCGEYYDTNNYVGVAVTNFSN